MRPGIIAANHPFSSFLSSLEDSQHQRPPAAVPRPWPRSPRHNLPDSDARPPQEPTAQRPFRSTSLPDWQMRAIRYLLDLEEMSCSIAEIEGDGKGVPVLLRQYPEDRRRTPGLQRGQEFL